MVGIGDDNKSFVLGCGKETIFACMIQIMNIAKILNNSMFDCLIIGIITFFGQDFSPFPHAQSWE